ncbi:MAG TPA: hypothetical protein VLW85_10390 [Myxococcales bacterium]|nr:hypothetical protein [Myxococcales bacterium]
MTLKCWWWSMGAVVSIGLLAACGGQAQKDVAPGGTQAAMTVNADRGNDWKRLFPAYTEWSPYAANLGPLINSQNLDSCVEISKTGLSLYFSSNRQDPGVASDRDLYVSQRPSVFDPWGPPVRLAMLSSTPYFDSCPALSVDLHRLYFSSGRPGGCGGSGNDLWMSYRADTSDDFGWGTPVHLACDPAGPNGPGSDLQPDLFRDDRGREVMYFVSNRAAPGVAAADDLYQAFVAEDGTVGPATPVTELNSSVLDTSPAVRRDGREIIFGSQRPGGSGVAGSIDFWTATRNRTSDPWSTPVFVASLGVPAAPPAASGAAYTQGKISLSCDGTQLYFASTRGPSFGDYDLWVATRQLRVPWFDYCEDWTYFHR